MHNRYKYLSCCRFTKKEDFPLGHNSLQECQIKSDIVKMNRSRRNVVNKQFVSGGVYVSWNSNVFIIVYIHSNTHKICIKMYFMIDYSLTSVYLISCRLEWQMCMYLRTFAYITEHQYASVRLYLFIHRKKKLLRHTKRIIFLILRYSIHTYLHLYACVLLLVRIHSCIGSSNRYWYT